MDTLNRYIGSDIPDMATDHIRTLLWLATEEDIKEDSGEDVWRNIDDILHENPYEDDETGEVFDNLKDFCEYYAKQFMNDIGSGSASADYIPSDAEDESVYMATRFGVAK